MSGFYPNPNNPQYGQAPAQPQYDTQASGMGPQRLCTCGIPVKEGVGGPGSKIPGKAYVCCPKPREDPTNCKFFEMVGAPPKKRYYPSQPQNSGYTGSTLTSATPLSSPTVGFNVPQFPQSSPVQGGGPKNPMAPSSIGSSSLSGDVASARVVSAVEQMMTHIQQQTKMVQVMVQLLQVLVDTLTSEKVEQDVSVLMSDASVTQNSKQ